MENVNDTAGHNEHLKDTAILSARYHAQAIQDALIVAYWQREKDDKAFHVKQALDAFENLLAMIAELKGFQK